MSLNYRMSMRHKVGNGLNGIKNRNISGIVYISPKILIKNKVY